MGYITHGLAVLFIIFEGIINQCGGEPNGTSSTTIHNLFHMPLDIIFSGFDCKAFQTRKGLMLLKKSRVRIYPDEFHGETREYKDENGESVLEFGSLEQFLTFFEKHGEKVKKIEIIYGNTVNGSSRDAIHQIIIRKCAKILKELRIVSLHDNGVWLEWTEGNKNIFPSIEKFKYVGDCSRILRSLSAVFQKLVFYIENVTFTDANRVADETNLGELQLVTYLLQIHQYPPMLEDNKEMTTLYLHKPENPETMKPIAEILTKLKILKVYFPVRNFLFQSEENRGTLHKLPSVIEFRIFVSCIMDIVGYPSIEMRNLKKFHLLLFDISWNKSYEEALEKINFIRHSKKLEVFKFTILGDAIALAIASIEKIFTKEKWTLSHNNEHMILNTITLKRQPN